MSARKPPRAKRGRPALPEARITVQIRMTTTERAAMEARAEREHLALGTWLRQLGMKATEVES